MPTPVRCLIAVSIDERRVLPKITRHVRGDVVDQALLRGRVRVQDEPGDGDSEQQQREERQEAEVGDRGGELAAVVRALQRARPARRDSTRRIASVSRSHRRPDAAFARVTDVTSRLSLAHPASCAPRANSVCDRQERSASRENSSKDPTGKRATKPDRPS